MENASEVLDKTLQKRFALLEKSRIHRIAEKCFQSDVPPLRERRIIAKGLGDVDQDVNLISTKPQISKVTYHPIDPEVIQQYNKWLTDRKTLREDLNQLGNYTSWIRGKKHPTALESRVLKSDTEKKNALYSDKGDSLPSTPDSLYTSMEDSEGDRTGSAESTPPPVTDGIRILQEYVDSRRLRLLDLFTQLDVNKNWTIEKSELTKLGLSQKQIEDLLGPLDKLHYKELKAAQKSLQAENRLIKKCLRPPFLPIKNGGESGSTNEFEDANADYHDAAPSLSNQSKSSSLSPLEWVQYSHRLVPSLESNLRDRILTYRDETWNDFNTLVTKCQKEGIKLSVLSLAKGLLAPGDRRWEECTKHIRQSTGLEAIKLQRPDTGKGAQDNMFSTDTSHLRKQKVSKYYDTTLQYRDMAKKNPGEKMRLSTGVAVIRGQTDCWMSYEEYLALTAKVRTKFRWVYGKSTETSWCGHLLDKIRLCMPYELSPNKAVSLFTHTNPNTRPVRANSRGSGIPTDKNGYQQTSTRVREYLL